MSFLSSTAIIDAVLTKKGRELLAAGLFNPTKFALSDDEIDYGLLDLEDGESKILETKILEASSLGNDVNTQLKYKLIISGGQVLIPTLSVEPASVASTIYDIMEIRLNTTDGGFDNSYTVVNSSSNLTINPYKAIYELNKQTYIAQSGKSYQSILSQLNLLKGIYGNLLAPAQSAQVSPDGVVVPGNQYSYPETYVTRPVGSDGSHKFFVFTITPSETLSKISVVGNNSGVNAEFSVTRIRTQIQSVGGVSTE